MRLRHLIAIAVLSWRAAGRTPACSRPARRRKGWYQWAANGLFAGDVTAVGKDETKPVDVITVRVVETFKGPDATNGTLTVRVPSRNWAACKLEVPVAGARVLVAMNANSEVLLVPLSASYAEKLSNSGSGSQLGNELRT